MKYGLNYFTDLHLTLLGLAIFFTWFSVMCFWVIKVLPDSKIKRLENIPFHEENT